MKKETVVGDKKPEIEKLKKEGNNDV